MLKKVKEYIQSKGKTGLRCAAQNGHTKGVKSLIACAADVNAKDKWDGTALHYAAGNGHTEIEKYLALVREKLLLKEEGIKKSAPGVVIGSVCATGGIIGLSF